jgi:hypothetical protein
MKNKLKLILEYVVIVVFILLIPRACKSDKKMNTNIYDVAPRLDRNDKLNNPLDN